MGFLYERVKNKEKPYLAGSKPPPMNADSVRTQDASRTALLNALNSRWKMTLYLLRYLPTLLFWGVRIKRVSEEAASVTIPFTWRTQNPFRSIYFAAQCGAAEISTGLLARVHLEGRDRVSMLITHVGATFSKKATGTATFTCNDGAIIREAIERAISSGIPQTATVQSSGAMANGEIVAQVQFTWSFKRKT